MEAMLLQLPVNERFSGLQISRNEICWGIDGLFNRGLVVLQLFKPRYVAASTTEGEYITLLELIRSIRYHYHIIQGLGKQR